MKKTMALLLVIALLLASTPAMAQDWKYVSENLNTSITLPGYLDVIGEFKGNDEDTVYIFFNMNETDMQIVGTMSYVPEYRGLQTKNLPQKEIDGWKAIFTASYPKRAKSMLIKPAYSSSQRIYRFYGLSKEGNWLLSYTGVKDGLYVSVSGETGKFGFKADEMRAIFEAFNDCFQMFAKSYGVDFVRFSPDDYEVEIFNLLYDDSPDSVFRTY